MTKVKLGRKRIEILRQLTGWTPPKMGRDIVLDSGGVLRSGTVYVHLDGMEEDGLLASELVASWEFGNAALTRREYWATERGERVYELHVAREGEAA